jgi:hypothetical protein
MAVIPLRSRNSRMPRFVIQKKLRTPQTIVFQSRGGALREGTPLGGSEICWLEFKITSLRSLENSPQAFLGTDKLYYGTKICSRTRMILMSCMQSSRYAGARLATRRSSGPHVTTRFRRSLLCLGSPVFRYLT